MENEIFEKAPVPKAFFTMALPVVFSMVISLVYNMVDTYFYRPYRQHQSCGRRLSRRTDFYFDDRPR